MSPIYISSQTPRKVLGRPSRDWLKLRQALLVHYNQICMTCYDNQIEGAVAEMQKWCRALSHYLTLMPPISATYLPRPAREWQKVKRSAEALKLSLTRLANPVFWKSSEWVSLISILGEAYTEHMIKEDKLLSSIGPSCYTRVEGWYPEL